MDMLKRHTLVLTVEAAREMEAFLRRPEKAGPVN